jgi:hypothetical protein
MRGRMGNSSFLIRNSSFVVIALWAVTTLLWLQPGIAIPDGAGYFVYLPSITLDHDLLFFDEWQRLGLIRDGVVRFKDATANGHLANHWTSGSAMAWAPAYLLGHGIAKVTGAQQNGFALPYNVPVIFTSAVAGLVALLLGLRLAQQRFGARAALLAAIGTWIGSPLMFYSLRHATMSHAVGAAACAAIVALSVRLREGVTAQRLFAVGLAVGFAFAVRPQNAPFVLVPLLLAPTRRFGWTILGALVGALPQLVVSQVLWGSPLAFANVGGQGNDWQSFARIRLFETIFSAYHGLAVWTPLLLFAIAGFAALYQADRGLGRAAIAMFAIQWVMNSTLDRAFWGGAAFGQRRFDNCTIFFLLGLAALFARLPQWASIGITAATSLWTLALFFAPLDLNAYQPLPELFDAALHARWRLSFVPPRARLSVWILMLATAALLALIAWIASRANGTALAAAYLLTFAIVFAWCGSHDAAHMAPWRDVKTGKATAETSILVVENEARWLAATGHPDAAARSFAEAATMRRRAGLP